MFKDEDIAVSLEVGVIVKPAPGAVVIRLAFAAGPERLLVFVSKWAYEIRDLLGAALDRRPPADSAEAAEIYKKLLIGRRPKITNNDVSVFDPKTVIMESHYDEWSDGVAVSIGLVDGNSTFIVLSKFMMVVLRDALARGIEKGGLREPKQSRPN